MKKAVFYQYLLAIFLGLSLVTGPCLVFAAETDRQSESELSRVMRNIKENEKTLKTFTAKFVQTEKTRLLQEPLHSEGLIYFDSAGKMLWKVTSPSPMIVLVKNNFVLTYYPDLKKAKKKRLGRSDNILKKYFGVGQPVKQLKKQYEIQLVSKTGSGHYHLRLIPKKRAMAKHITAIDVIVNPKTWLPEQVHFKQAHGDHTSVRIQYDSVNEPLPPGIFSINMVEDEEPQTHADTYRHEN